jgi:hypothetical protein
LLSHIQRISKNVLEINKIYLKVYLADAFVFQKSADLLFLRVNDKPLQRAELIPFKIQRFSKMKRKIDVSEFS